CLLLPRDRRLQRAVDVVRRARVDLDVGREVGDRLVVAVDRIDIADRAVVPVVQQQLPARRGRRGGRREDRERRTCGDDQREETAVVGTPWLMLRGWITKSSARV